jgi:predicted small secreted protein
MMILRRTARPAVHAVAAAVLLVGCQSTFTGIGEDADYVVSGVIGRTLRFGDDTLPLAVRISWDGHASGTMEDSLDVVVRSNTKVFCGPLDGAFKACGPESFVTGALLKAQTTGTLLTSLPGSVMAAIVEVRQPS